VEWATGQDVPANSHDTSARDGDTAPTFRIQ
jgi:hypothetical protein